MHKKLITDFGNTFQKLAVFDGKKLVLKEAIRGLDAVALSGFIEKNGPFTGIILSSVANHDVVLENILSRSGRFILLDSKTPVPFKNLYHTPETLGKDRIAAVTAARSLFPGKNVLVIDAGTCLTFDIITADGDYPGGAISPGIRMRFRALHTFTGKLPLIEPEGFDELIGKSTMESLLSGVLNGVLAEITNVVSQYHEKFEDLKVIITGGDHQFLHNKLKINIFAVPDLVLLGLNEILDYNDQKN